MRRMLSLAVLLLVAAPVAGQGTGMDFSEDHQVRIALGNIPTTTADEPAGSWNFHETVTVDPASDLTLELPAGHSPAETPVDCACEHTVTDNGDGTYTVSFPGTYDGPVEVEFAHRIAGGLPFSAGVELRSSWAVILYVPAGSEVEASTTGQSFPCTSENAGCDLHWFQGDVAETFAFTARAPAVVTSTPTGTGGDEGTGTGFDWMALAIGLLAGALIWALLVQQGLVQKRSRKQVAATAAHKEVASNEPRESLEARKRLLMASLKELELAKMNKEVETEVYDALKAEYKKQTVTVMRALEESA